MDQVGLQNTTAAGMAGLAAFFGVLLLGGAVLWASANPLLRGAAVLGWLLAVGVGAVLNKWGIVQDRPPIAPRQQAVGA